MIIYGSKTNSVHVLKYSLNTRTLKTKHSKPYLIGFVRIPLPIHLVNEDSEL